jgi:hypothetical protein
MKCVAMSVQCPILSLVGRGGERSAAKKLQLMARTGLAANANVPLVSEAGGQLVVVT